MDPSVLEATIHSTLDRLSNNEPVEFEEEWIEEAGEQFKAALKKQFTPRDPEFRVRMSNVGRPLCQLQMQKANAPQSRMPYNHIVRMLIGDSAEVVLRIIMRMAGVNVTSDGDKVALEVAGETIKGDSDIDVDNKVYDIKSSSPWGFQNKWLKGYAKLAENDSFGYVGQLSGYADAQEKDLGGWIVVDKSSGEVAVVGSEATEDDVRAIRTDRKNKVIALQNDVPFMRQFEPIEETYYGKSTGAKKLPMECTFCNFMKACWPEAERLPAPKSKAKNPARNWYVQHPDMEKAE